MIRWLIQSAAGYPALAAGVAPDGLLAPPEQERCAALAHPKRRRDWLLGRWTAKHLLQAHLLEQADIDAGLDALIIANAPDGSPYAILSSAGTPRKNMPQKMPLSVSLSISHSKGHAFCAVCDIGAGMGATNGSPQVGADIERIESRSPTFVHDFFTPREIQLIYGAPPHLRDTLITAIWSAKEAVFKALHTGLPMDTRTVECLVAPEMPDGWRPFLIHTTSTGSFAGWWRLFHDGLTNQRFVLTLVCKTLTNNGINCQEVAHL